MPQNGYGAYGEAALFPTNNLDNSLNLIYQEHRQRQARREQENALIDKGIQEEYGKVNSNDIPEYMKYWGAYRDIKKQLLFDNKLQRDPVAYQQKQREAQIALGNLHKVGRGSAERNDVYKNLFDSYNKNPDLFDDDAGRKLLQFSKTPTSQLGQVQGYDAEGQPTAYNLLDPSTYRLTGGNFDMAKHLKDARGIERVTYEDVKPFGKEGLQQEVIPFKTGNSTTAFRNYIGGVLGDAKARKYARAQANNYTPQEMNDVMQQFDSIPADEWKKRGETKPKLPVPHTPEEVYMNMETMKYALENTARADKSYTRDVEENIDNKKRREGRADDVFRSNLIQNREISVAQTKKRLGLLGADKSGDVAINDAYSRINNSIGNNEEKKLSEMNLGADDIALLMQMAKNSISANYSATPDLITIKKDNNGVARINFNTGGTDGIIPLGSLSAAGVNLKGNPKDRKTRSKILGAKNTSPTVHRAKMPDGRIITSSDGVNWTDEKGNPVK